MIVNGDIKNKLSSIGKLFMLSSSATQAKNAWVKMKRYGDYMHFCVFQFFGLSHGENHWLSFIRSRLAVAGRAIVLQFHQLC